MFKFSVFLCCLYFCALTPYLTLAMTDDQKAAIHAHFESIGKTCIKDNMISEEDIGNLRARRMPTGANAPCFLACMMREMGIMDESGMLKGETILEMAKAVFEDEEEIQLIKDYLHSCSHINTESVGDGSKGCDRAMIAYKCMIDNASQFGIMI